MSAPVLEIGGVSKEYHALRPLRLEQLTIGAGDSVAILGLDQTAAEVLVNVVTGAALPDAGDVRLFGRPTASITDSADWLAIVDRIGIVSDRAVLLEPLTVTQNLAMPFTLDVEPPPDDVRVRAEALAQEVRLPAAVWTQPVTATGPDIRARVRLGRALALDPQLLLLEHASVTLRPPDAMAFGRDARRIAERRAAAVLVLTADEAFARAVATRVLVFDAATGRLTARRRGWFG
jgi:ABC-type transporter Mla maintaining outer membrane lipid asymmetry ATPase subunit MlaF